MTPLKFIVSNCINSDVATFDTMPEVNAYIRQQLTHVKRMKWDSFRIQFDGLKIGDSISVTYIDINTKARSVKKVTVLEIGESNSSLCVLMDGVEKWTVVNQIINKL